MTHVTSDTILPVPGSVVALPRLGSTLSLVDQAAYSHCAPFLSHTARRVALLSTLAAYYNYSARSTLLHAEIKYFPANERRAGRVKNITRIVQSRSQDPIGACQLGSGGLGWSGW